MTSSLTLQWTKSFPCPLHPRAPRAPPYACCTQGSWWATAPRACQAQARVCLLCVCVCVVADCVWWSFLLAAGRERSRSVLFRGGGTHIEGLCVFLVCEGLCALCSLPLQQLQLSAEALARSFLSSLMGSGNSLYNSTSVSCLRAFRAIVWKACSTLMASLALVSK